MRFPYKKAYLLGLSLILGVGGLSAADIPLPEHPRPDFERAAWVNLNGEWGFRADADDRGAYDGWEKKPELFTDRIMVPFPWGSPLSGVEDTADIGWYGRGVKVPEDWKGQRVFLVVGACDWLTQGWLDGKPIGSNRGGYTQFEMELTSHVEWGKEQSLVLRVDDLPHPFKLEGKQGYGEAKGIWQTVYLEARPAVHVKTLYFTPELRELPRVKVKVELSDPAPAGTRFELAFETGGVKTAVMEVAEGAKEVSGEIAIRDAHLWSLEDPFLYEVKANLRAGGAVDTVGAYFGMRSISVMPLPGHGHNWVALNGKPIYLQITLDQSYHPEGYYTFPSDAFMRDEILRSKRIGLNANRFHVKVDVPRKIYWADKLGLLVMADVPNSWGEPGEEMRKEIDIALRGMIERDFNHPSIFSWVPFNETWGLFTGKGEQRAYLPETQEWVASVVRLTKQLDPTRLVEDNSPCNLDHVETDINSWHKYLPGYEWKEHLEQVVRDTHPGSTWNFIGGNQQSGQLLLNSECGNVWGYEGSAGDVDYTWDYHIMINEFRRHPKICGWLYTEHHDVTNEWNGYYRFDRSDKVTGMDELVGGMSLRDLHSLFYISTGSDLCRDVKPGETVEVPMFASFLTDVSPGGNLVLKAELYGWDGLGRGEVYTESSQVIRFKPWMAEDLKPMRVRMPSHPAVAVLALRLENEAGAVLHRNFTTFRVKDGAAPREEKLRSDGTELRVLRKPAAEFSAQEWTVKQWNVLDGLKVNGAGAGSFEYRYAWPEEVKIDRLLGATFLVEASAKRLHGKDRQGAGKVEGDFMRGKGTLDPSLNPNAYPMTDAVAYPSSVRVRVNGRAAGSVELQDDPADHRGILSWHAQPRDHKLREAGSYGYLVAVPLPVDALAESARTGEIVIRLEVDDALPGGLAIYGEDFGRYAVEPTVVLQMR
ncbi:MAG: hypothetical protein RI897_1083 [Verrucomicrobiota bacterium]|jgi:hypothetical protein